MKIKELLMGLFLAVASCSPVYAHDIVTRFIGDGNDRITSRSVNADTVIDLGSGADIIVTGGGNGRNVEVNAGNDRVMDKVYNESLPQFIQADGSVLPWVGRHVITNGVEQGRHIYHLGMGDESRITLPVREALPENGGYRMSTAITRGVFIIHGPGSPNAPTRIKAFDRRGQQIAMSSGDIYVSTLTGEELSDGRFKVLTFVLRGITNDPATNNQYILVDLYALNSVQEIIIDPPYNSINSRVNTLRDYLIIRRLVVEH